MRQIDEYSRAKGHMRTREKTDGRRFLFMRFERVDNVSNDFIKGNFNDLAS